MPSIPRLLLAMVLLLAAVGCEPGEPDVADEPAPPPIPDPVHYAALGDSLGTGTGAETSYVAEYAQWLEAETGSRVDVADLAVDGWTSQDLLDALTDDPAMRTAVADAHVVTWAIGGNDLLEALATFFRGGCGGPDGQECFREAVEQAVDNGEAVIDELLALREGDPDGLRTFDLYLPFVDDPFLAPLIEGLRTYLDELNRQLADRAEDRGIAVADVADAFHGPDGSESPAARGLISDDGLHPSDRGHELIAEELAALDLELGRVG